MSAKVSKYVVEVIDVNLMLSIYKYQVHFDITNSSRVSSENFKPSDFKKGSMESMFSRVLQFWSFLVERPCQERENLQSDHILLVQVIVKWFLSLLTLSLSELFAKLTFSLWFLLSTSKKKGINVVKKLQLWNISQSNQCEVSLDVKPEMPTETQSQLLDDFVVLSEVTLNYLLWMVMITLLKDYWWDKEVHFFDKVIPLTVGGSINQIWKVACLNTNSQEPLLFE